MSSSSKSDYIWEERYDITYTVLVGVLILGLLPLFIFSLIRIRRRRDPARFGFLWLKNALGVMLLAVILATAESIMIVLLNTYTLDYFEVTESVIESVDRLDDWAYFFLNLSTVLALLAVFEVALGILYCWGAAATHTTRMLVRAPAYLFALVELALLLAKLGLYEAFWTVYFHWLDDQFDTLGDQPSQAGLLTSRKLLAAFYILLFVATTAVVGLAIGVVVKARSRAEHLQSSVLVLAAAVCLWIEALWNLIEIAVWILPQKHEADSWSFIVTALLGIWPQVIALALIFAVGRKKVGGLWTSAMASHPKMQQQQQHYGYDEQDVMRNRI